MATPCMNIFDIKFTSVPFNGLPYDKTFIKFAYYLKPAN